MKLNLASIPQIEKFPRKIVSDSSVEFLLERKKWMEFQHWLASGMSDFQILSDFVQDCSGFNGQPKKRSLEQTQIGANFFI